MNIQEAMKIEERILEQRRRATHGSSAPICPHCGKEIDDFPEDALCDEWDDGTHTYDDEITCEHCGALVSVTLTKEVEVEYYYSTDVLEEPGSDEERPEKTEDVIGQGLMFSDEALNTAKALCDWVLGGPEEEAQ
jgi:DNA-directed RNA polymerase subunit RPC12/RpoP